MSVPAALGLRALRGGAVAVGVALDAEGPRVVLSSFLATAEDGDRLAFEPYHVAVEMAHRGDGDPAAAIAEGRRRQDTLGAKGLGAIRARLRDVGCDPALAALLLNRAGWLTEEHRLAHSLSAPEHPPVIEGLAVRDALRFAAGQCSIEQEVRGGFVRDFDNAFDPTGFAVDAEQIMRLDSLSRTRTQRRSGSPDSRRRG